jgi:hypothetical protein
MAVKCMCGKKQRLARIFIASSVSLKILQKQVYKISIMPQELFSHFITQLLGNSSIRAQNLIFYYSHETADAYIILDIAYPTSYRRGVCTQQRKNK